MEMPPKRYTHIVRMLKRRVTVEEAIAIMAPFDSTSKSKKGRHGGIPVGPIDEGPHARSIRALAAGMFPGDELWHYDSDPQEWENLCGEMGFAVVRNGEVVASEMHFMN